MAYPWGDERRFNSYNSFLRKHFGGRVQRIAIDAGFTCPNRDGTCGTGGCTFCCNSAFNPSYCSPNKSIQQQLTDGKLFHQNRRQPSNQYFAYFQAFSNTYASLDHLKTIFEEAATAPDIVGIIIATRPDCLTDETLDYLAELQQRLFVSIEIGIESCRDITLERIHRGHNLTCAIDAIQRTAQRHLPVGTHLIFGLPGETPSDWLDDQHIINHLPIHSIKFHQLQIIKGTPIEAEFMQKPSEFYRFTIEDYVEFLCKYLTSLRPDIIIERMASEVPARYLSQLSWGGISYDKVLQKIEKRMTEKEIWQGLYFQ